jgi:uncharacterized protein with PIN domain
MGRSDTYLLNVPRAADEAQPVAEDVFEPAEAVHAELPVMRRPEALAPVVRELLKQCPYCKSRLSAVEAKMERCLSCGAQLEARSASAAPGEGEEYIVRI